MTKREIGLLALACTFIGIVMGFALAPIKKGQIIYCGNNCGNNNSARYEKVERKSRAERQQKN